MKAGSTGSLNFKLLEGECDEPADNRFIGLLKISGYDFDDGVIPAGGDLQCDFEMLDSGNIVLEVSVPSIRGTFQSERNFYSRQEGQLDFSKESARISEEGERTLKRVEEMEDVIDDRRLELARSKLAVSSQLNTDEPDTERSQEAMEGVMAARRLLAQVRRDNLKEIRQVDLDREIGFFNEHIRRFARPSEEGAFDNLVQTSQRAINRDDRDFESLLNELKDKTLEILWRQDWFVVGKFRWMASSPYNFSDPARFKELMAKGMSALKSDDIDGLRQVVAHLGQIQL